MGGVEVDPDTQQSLVPGLYAAGEVGGGMHGSNRLGGNSLGDLLVFGKRAGESAAAYVSGLGDRRPAPAPSDVEAAVAKALAPLSRKGGENPYDVHHDLQQTMNDLVGIIRTADELEQALKALDELKVRASKVSATGGRAFNPGWHLAIDLDNMLLVSECTARAALERQESRGGHTRDDYPATDPEWGKVNLILTLKGGKVDVKRQPLPQMPAELASLFEEKK
jgi:succinate dehydrogenase / fumarate reductase flavoprotein subunit